MRLFLHGLRTGPFYPYPIISAYFLAAQGKTDQAKNCIDAAWALWEEYARIVAASSPMAKNTSVDSYLLKLYRSCLGWAGIYAFGAHIILNVQMNDFQFGDVSEEEGAMVKACYSITGLKMLEWGFLEKDRDPDFTVEELQAWFRDAIQEQIDSLAATYSG